MAASKSPRTKAWEGLERLSADRVDKNGSIPEIFHWGIIAPNGRDPIHDRATALVATAVVEHGLEYAILANLARNGPTIRDILFEGRGAILRDFSSKTAMAHAMGIIGDETRCDLGAIRRIRNTFAHSRLKIDFDTPEIIAACEQITVLKRLHALGQGSLPKDMRENFLTSCFEFSVWLFTVDDNAAELSPSGHPPRDQLTV